jgi:murein DD-endopeptidase MepM/ murein hydrolase activator NlpD
VEDFSRNSRYLAKRRARRVRRKRLFSALSVLALVLALIFGALVLLQRGPLTPYMAQETQEATPTPAENADAVPPPSPVPSVSPPVSPPVSPQPTAPGIGATEPLPTRQANAVPAAADAFFASARFSYAHDFYVPQIQTFLDGHPGPLKSTRFQVGDRSHTFAEVVVNLSNLYSFNPRILLTLLEQQSALLSTGRPTPDQLSWAMGYQDEDERHSGVYAQLRWAAIALRHASRDYALAAQGAPLPELVFADDTRQPATLDMGLPRYALARVLAPTTTPDQLPTKLEHFRKLYTYLFEDPTLPPADWPPLAEPFLSRPTERPFRVTSFFDHDTPFLRQNGSLTSFWGTSEAFLSYDGHTGWDYAMRPPDKVLAAADGMVVFAGNSDDGCGVPARAVILDHGNGYRTLYWHLHAIHVELGQMVARGAEVGIAGATGCAFGPHLHFQVQYLGRDVDPYGWCGDHADPWASNPVGQTSIWLWQDMLNPCGEPPPGTIVVDNGEPGFEQSGEWQASGLGYGGDALYSSTRFGGHPSERQPWQVRTLVESPAVAIWQPELPQAGHYRVLAYIPYILNGLDDSQELRYQVQHRDGETVVRINAEETANAWADLGTYVFDPTQRPRVSLSTLAGDEARGLWADAVAWVPVAAAETARTGE